jgi:hypothetical protein
MNTHTPEVVSQDCGTHTFPAAVFPARARAAPQEGGF